MVYFYYTAKPKTVNPINYLRAIYEKHAKKKLFNEEPNLFQYIESMIEGSNSTGCEFIDYYELYKSIRLRKPLFILECGSGISSCVIAYAVYKNLQETKKLAKFISLEEDNYYHEQVKKIFPQDLISYVDFYCLERVERYYNEFLGCHYDNVPDYPYDFIFIDGPTLRKKNRNSTKCFNADYINVVLKSDKNVFGILDQRVSTYLTFKKLMPKAKINYSSVKRLAETLANKDSLISLNREDIL